MAKIDPVIKAMAEVGKAAAKAPWKVAKAVAKAVKKGK